MSSSLSQQQHSIQSISVSIHNRSTTSQHESSGTSVRLTKTFIRRRNLITEKRQFQSNCLQSRLKKLLDVGRNPSLTLAQLKELEQSIIAWEPDDSVTSCRICQALFTAILNRKHHCRLCGCVICRSCSVHEHIQESLSIRICSTCLSILNITRKPPPSPNPPIVDAYQDLAQLRSQINDTVPKLSTLVSKLKSQLHSPPTDPVVRRTRALAMTFKKDLDSDLSKITNTCQMISNLPTETDQSHKLHQNIVLAYTNWIHSIMPTLNAANDVISVRAPKPEPSPGTIAAPVAPNIDSPPAAPSKYTEQYLSMLVEQYTQLLFFFNEAKQQRQLDNARTLQMNLDDISREIQAAETHLYGVSQFQP